MKELNKKKSIDSWKLILLNSSLASSKISLNKFINEEELTKEAKEKLTYKWQVTRCF